MKSYRFRFFRFGRPRRNLHVRGTSVLFKRFSSFEGLELRSMLTGSSLLADSALVSDPHASPVEQLSLVSMLSSTLGNGDNDAPNAAPLAANATEDTGSNDPPVADPLTDHFVATVTLLFEDLDGNAIPDVTDLRAGSDFIVKVFVTDIRTDSDLSGVASASVRLKYDTNLIALNDPSSVIVADNFQDLLPFTDTDIAGQIDAGGSWLETVPENLPAAGEPQLLWSARLHALADGTANFTTEFVGDNDQELLLFGAADAEDPSDFDFQSATLTIEALPTISVADVSQVETNANSSYVFTVSLSAASTQQVTVVYNTTAGTATSGSDFTPTSGTLVFEPGALTKQVMVTVLGDTNSEADETFNVVLSSPTNATLGDATGVGTILDDDSPLLIFQDVSQSEQDGVDTMIFTVTLSKAATSNVVVQYNTADGTALAGSDYTATSGTLTFTAGGSLQQLITVTVNGDTVEEDNETFQVLLTNPTGAEFETDGTAIGTILNDDGPVLGINPVSASLVEGDSGESFMVFTITLTETNDQTITVVYNTADGTATAGSDYTATSGTLTFAASGPLSQTVTVAILGDTIDEVDETFSLVLSSPENATIAINPGIGTILDDDGPAISLTGPAGVNENAGNYVVTATLSAASPQTVTVVWSTANDTGTNPATAGTDYTAASGTLTFAPGQTTALITVGLTGDDVVEPSETFKINLSNPVNGELGTTPEFTATIANDDDVPVVSVVAPASQNEGNVGGTPFVFTVNLSKAGTETITVVFNTANAIAQAGSDYTATSGTLTFDVGETSKTVTVLVTGDILHENANETFRLDLSSPTGATLGTSAATAVIVDDDTQPSVSISDVIATEGDSGTKQFVFTVTLTNPSVNAVTVQYATQDGTATANGDYTATSGTLTFAPNELTKVITVNVVGDLLNEENETFSVMLSSPVAATIGDATGIGTIQDEASDNINIVPSTVAGKVFIDTNGNGAQNGLEKSLAGITVNLTGAATKSTTTAADGSYSFADLNPGTYTVKFVLPSQYRDGAAILGNSGGSQVEDGYTFTIEGTGGATATGYHFATSGLLPQFISQRQLLSSYLANLSEGVAQVGVSINTVTNPINASNANNTTISGTGTVGATISVVASDGTNSTVAQTATVGANGTWSISGINVLTLADGTITYTVTATKDGTTDTDTITATKDTVVPDVTATTVTNPINSNNQIDTAISGTGTPNATISVIVTDGTNSTSAFTTTVAAGGTWSIGGINVTALANGTLTYNVTATDTAGNTKTASITSLKDSQAPAVAVTAVTDPIDTSNEDNVSISGTVTAGSTVTVNITDSGSGTSGPHTATVTGGTWTLTGLDLTSLADGTITFTVVATDAVNNTTQITATSTKDTATEVVISSVTSPINAANQTNTTISGTGEPGATISVVVSIGTSSTEPMTTEVATDGTWSITGIDVSDLPEGTLTYTVTSTDESNNTDEAEIETIKDTVAPELDITDVTYPIDISNETATAINGTSNEPGAMISVEVSDGTNTTIAYTTTVDSSEEWSIESIDVSDLNDGTLTYTVTASDAAGNTTVDTIEAVKTTVAIGSVPDLITQSNQDDVVVSGTGQVGATVVVVATNDGEGPVTSEEVTIDENGNWTVTLDVTSLADGTITFVATATDGDDSATASLTTDKDTIAEGAILEFSHPVNAANVTNVFLNGLAELGATVSIVVTDDVDNSTEPVEAVAEAGVWAITGIDVSDLAEGTITYIVTITDEHGNVTEYTMTALKDTIAPELEIGLVTPDPIGISDADDVSISGTVEVGSTVSIIVTDGTNSTTAVTATVDSEGNWTASGIDVSGLADGTLTFNVTATDLGGNTATDNSRTAEKTTVAITNVPDPITQADEDEVVVSGTGQVGATVVVVASDGTVPVTSEEVTIDENGNWTVTLNVTSLADGTITFTATATEGEDSVETSITAVKDTVAEGEILIVTELVNSANEANTSVSGTAEAGARVSIEVTDNVTTTDPIEAVVEDGAWSITGVDVSSLADGTITYIVTIVDEHGNVTEYTMTTLKDTVTEVEITDVDDPIDIALSDSVTISGTGEVEATISVVVSDGVNSTTAVITIVGSEGNWSIEDIDVSTLDDGTLTFTVTATDLAGNTNTDTITAEKVTLAITGVPDIISQVNEDEVVISGTGQVGASVVVEATDGDATITADAVTIDGDGNWSVTLDVSDSLEDGTITFNVTATAGEDSVQKSATTIMDRVAEGQILTAPNPINADNVGSASLTGTTEVGSSISISVSDGTTTLGPFVAAVNEIGEWSVGGINLTSLLDDVPITYTMTVIDTKGNSTSHDLLATKDTVPPELSEPFTPPLNIVNSPAYMMGGSTDPGATISVTFTDENELAVTIPGVVDAEGDWSFEDADLSSLADGDITIKVVATDAAGNTTELTLERTKDTIAPDVDATTVDPTLINAATDEAVTISGTGEPGATISVAASDGVDAVEPNPVTQVDEAGNWTITIDVSSLIDGTITFTATATDSHGNTATDTITAQKDTVASIELNVESDVVSAANAESFAVFGTREFMSTVSVSVTDGVITIVRDSTSPGLFFWSIPDLNLTSLADGPLTITATATDLAGNTATQQLIVQKDTTTTVFITSVTELIDADNQTDTMISGTGEVGATISVTASDGVNETIAFSIVVDEAGDWSISGIDVTSLDDGTITYTATATDTAGNTDEKTITAEKDTEAEPLALLADDGGSDDADADSAFDEDEDWLSFD